MRINIKNRITLILSLVCMCILIFLGHYLTPLMTQEGHEEMQKLFLTIMGSLGSTGGWFLWRAANGDRAKKLFSIFITSMGVLAILTLVYLLKHGSLPVQKSLSPLVILSSWFFSFMIGLYPIEVLRPGWLNWKRIGLLLLPIPIISFFALILTFFLGPIEKLDSIQQIATENPIYILLRLFIFIYPLGTCVTLWMFKREYETWCQNNFVVTERMSIGWLNYYLIGIFGIVSSYLYLMTVYSPKSNLLHSLLSIIFTVCFYNKAFMHESPYAVDEFEEDSLKKENERSIVEPEEEKRGIVYDHQMNRHKEVLLEWFEKEKPYLRKDFRLQDLNEKIPVNRTYLSRLINEELNTNFNNLITDYRLKESILLIEKNPTMPLKDIADCCGFSSSSVYSRAFAARYNTTPSKYRSEKKLS